jgi:hypothetical protein
LELVEAIQGEALFTAAIAALPAAMPKIAPVMKTNAVGARRR